MSVDLNPPSILPSRKLRTSQQWLAEADRILSEGVRGKSFNREAQAQFECAMQMVSASRLDAFNREQYNIQQGFRDAARTMDPATLAFFSGGRPSEAVVSESGGRLEKRSAPGTGAVLELRDVSGEVRPEMRSYGGLDSSTSGDAAGYSVPIGFFRQVFFNLRMVDGLFNAARWVFTPTGNAMDFPMAIEAGSGKTLAEADTVGQSNPTFYQTQWPLAPAWSSDEIVMSIQFLQDCGAPDSATLMSQIFAIRISRGLGADFVNSLLTDAHATTAAGMTAVTTDELLGLIDGVSDSAYAYKPTSGWLMHPATLTKIWKMTGAGSGLFVFPRKFNDAGLPLLLEQPIYLCPNFPSMTAGNKPIAFGDLSRFVVRAVGESFTVFRYVEKYMPWHQTAFQAYWRASGKLVSADKGVSDFPICVLQMKSS